MGIPLSLKYAIFIRHKPICFERFQMPTVKTIKANIKNHIAQNAKNFKNFDYEKLSQWFGQVGFTDSDEIPAFNNENFLKNWNILHEFVTYPEIKDKNIAKYVIDYLGKQYYSDKSQNAENVSMLKRLLSAMDEVTPERYQAIIDNMAGFRKTHQDSQGRFTLEDKSKSVTAAENCIELMQKSGLHLTGSKLTGKGKDNIAKLLQQGNKLDYAAQIFGLLFTTKTGLTQERFDAVVGNLDKIDMKNIKGLLGCIDKMQKHIHLTGDKITKKGEGNLVQLLKYPEKINYFDQIFELMDKETEEGVTQERFDAVLAKQDKITKDNIQNLLGCITVMSANKLHFTGDKITGKGKDNLKNLLEHSEKSEFLQQIFNKISAEKPGLTQDRFDVVMSKVKNINDKNVGSFVRCIEHMQKHVHLTGDKLTGAGKDNLSKLLDAPEKIEEVDQILTAMEPINQNRYNSIMDNLPALSDKDANDIVRFINIMQAQNLPLTKNGVLAEFINLPSKEQKDILKIFNTLTKINSDPANFEAVAKNMAHIVKNPDNIDPLCEQINKAPAGGALEPNWFDKLLKTLFNVPLPLEKLLMSPKATPTQTPKVELSAPPASTNTSSSKRKPPPPPPFATPTTTTNLEENPNAAAGTHKRSSY